MHPGVLVGFISFLWRPFVVPPALLSQKDGARRTRLGPYTSQVKKSAFLGPSTMRFGWLTFFLISFLPSGWAALSPDTGNPLVYLARDSGLRTELELTASEERDLDAVLDAWNEKLFSLRILHLVPDKARAEIDAIQTGFESELREKVAPRVWARLDGIRLQTLGAWAFLRPDLAERLDLRPDQRQKLESLQQQTRQQAQSLANSMQQGATANQIAPRVQRLNMSFRQKAMAILTEEQRATWNGILGKPYAVPAGRQILAKAPELREVSEWVGGDPVVLEQERGKVVVVHFFAADCINCIRNFPHYKKWRTEFSPEEVTLVGIHTPETSKERDPNHAKKKFREQGLNFPVALDTGKKNWDAWTNRMWPSVYLIDKQGNVREWWYGELEWQGRQGERHLRNRIRALLQESSDQ